MAEPQKIRDDPRAIDAKATIAGARRRTLLTLLGQLILWGIVITIVVFTWSCLSRLADFAPETEVPLQSEAPPAPGQ